MTESRAWLIQADSDYVAANRILTTSDGLTFCHTIAKYQQAVEKSIKGLVAALTESGVFGHQVGRPHEIERFMSVLCRLPRDPDYKSIQSQIHGLLNETVRGEIHAIEALIPRWPRTGQLHARNTEYPFNDVPGSWRAPAEADVFTRTEVDRFRQLAFRFVQGCKRIMSALSRVH